jgi:hypothetical protein
MKNMLARLWKEEEGQDLTEYALLLVLVALAAIGSLGTPRETSPNRPCRFGVGLDTES